MSTLIPTGFGNITVLRGSKYVGIWDWEETDFTGMTAIVKIKNIHPEFNDVKNAYEVGVATVCPLDIDGNPYTNRIQIELSKEDTLKFAIPASEDFSFGEESGYYSVLNIILDDGTVVLTANVKVVNSLEAETLNFLLDEKDEAIIINQKLDEILANNQEFITQRDTYLQTLSDAQINIDAQVEDITTKHGEINQIKDDVIALKGQVETIFDNFDDRYLGPFDTAPTLDNDGEALAVGAIYLDTVDKELKFYNGVSWDSPVAAAQTYAQQASQSASDANASKLATAQLKSDVEAIAQQVNNDKQAVSNDKLTVEGIRDSLQASVNDIANKVNISDVQDLLNSTDPTKPLSANQGKILKGYIDTINSLLLSDNTTLDSLQEIVDFIEMNRTTLEALGISNIAGLQSALDSKQATIQDGGLPILKLDMDGATDIGANLVDTDLIIVDDGANGTNRKSAISRIWTYISGKLTGAISTVTTTNLTASKVLISDASGKIAVSDVSSTTLGYLDATSSVQTQLNAKAALSSPALTGTPTINGVNVSGYSGFKNYIINGNFDIWQRGESFSSIYSTFFTADRWLLDGAGVASGLSASKQPGLVGKNSLYITRTGGAYMQVHQMVENQGNLSNKTFTFSALVRSTTNGTINFKVVDGRTGTNFIYEQTPVTLEANIPKKIVFTTQLGQVSADALFVGLLTTCTDLYIGAVQLEEGSIATPFETRPYGLELSLCQRYYETSGGVFHWATHTPEIYSVNPIIMYNTTKRVVASVSVSEQSGTLGIQIVGNTVNGFDFRNENSNISGSADKFIAWTASAEL